MRELLRSEKNIEQILARPGKEALGISHARAGDLIAVAMERAWFTYYYWLDDSKAPDFARTVDIHRKPGYDPVELFLDPTLKLPKLQIASRLLKKKLGFRMLMDLIPLDASLVKGSHGRRPDNPADYPVLITSKLGQSKAPLLKAVDVYSVLREILLSIDALISGTAIRLWISP